MIATPFGLVGAANAAGIVVPENSLEDYPEHQYTYWKVFCVAQLGRPLHSWNAPYTNAVIVAKIPADQIKTITFEQLRELGFDFGD